MVTMHRHTSQASSHTHVAIAAGHDVARDDVTMVTMVPASRTYARARAGEAASTAGIVTIVTTDGPGARSGSLTSAKAV